MTKYPKWRVGVAVTRYYLVESSAENETDAIEAAFEEVKNHPEYFLTGVSKGITGVFINDKETRNFSPFCPEAPPQHNDIGSWESNSQ